MVFDNHQSLYFSTTFLLDSLLFSNLFPTLTTLYYEEACPSDSMVAINHSTKKLFLNQSLPVHNLK